MNEEMKHIECVQSIEFRGLLIILLLSMNTLINYDKELLL